MNIVFHEYLDKFIIIFINGILMYSKNTKEHEEHLKIALQLLKEKKLYGKFKNCEFWLDRVIF